MDVLKPVSAVFQSLLKKVFENGELSFLQESVSNTSRDNNVFVIACQLFSSKSHMAFNCHRAVRTVVVYVWLFISGGLMY